VPFFLLRYDCCTHFVSNFEEEYGFITTICHSTVQLLMLLGLSYHCGKELFTMSLPCCIFLMEIAI